MHLRSPFLLLLGKSVVKLPKRKRVRQEEEEEEAKQGEEAAERTGEDLCHLSEYNNETARAVSLNTKYTVPATVKLVI